MNSENKTIPVDSDDAGINEAMETARRNFAEFWLEVSTDYQRIIPVLGPSMVKAYFFDETAPVTGSTCG